MKNLNSMVVILFALLLTACNPKYYSANTQNVALISNKGETNLTFAGNGNQVEFQGAYGISNGFAINANGGLYIPKDNDNGDGGSGSFFEIGGGYFKALGHNLIFETYAIAGIGKVENHFPSTVQANPQTLGDISANVLRYGLQPNIGYKSKNFSVALSSRFVNLNYSKIEGDLIYDGVQQVGYLEENKSNFLIEPALTLRGGLDKIKVQFQLGRSINISNSEFSQDKSFATMGLNFNFQ